MSTERKKSSLGKSFYNKGGKLELKEERYVVDKNREFYLFDVIPMGAVRMTKSDRWKTNPNHPDTKKRQRKAVANYWKFKKQLLEQAIKLNFPNEFEYLDAVYFLPMPDSWSEKKKERMNGMPCKVKPDCDNICKGVIDTLLKQDSMVWYQKSEKRWAYKGSVLIYK